jgi:glycosyltransferase involved in cell wall biosynthesis
LVLDRDSIDGDWVRRSLADGISFSFKKVTATRNGRIQVLALTPIPEEGAGCRFRVSQYIPYLHDAGFDVTVSPFYSREYFGIVYRPGKYVRKVLGFIALTWRRWRELYSIPQYDVVLLYREAIPIGPPIVERWIHRLGIPIVYDFDDAIFLPAVSEANKAVSFLKNPRRVSEILKLSQQVTVGNEFLAGYARRFNSHVTVIPTVVDTNRFVPRTSAGSDETRKLVVGWIGSPTTFRYLESLKDVLAAVAARHPFMLKVSGAGRPVDFPGVDVQVAPWSMADEVSLFNTCDIGVYPLTDDDWSRGKCGFKAIQCMACGVPVVAAAVGVNREIITHGVNSMLASTPQDWIDHLSELLTNAALRRSMAVAGRQTIEARYSLRVTAPQLAGVLQTAAHPNS